MITWIQKTFQQHFRLIFLVLLAVVIVSFIFVTNASSGLGRREYRAGKRPFYGLDLGNEQDATRLARDASVSDFLRTRGRLRENDLQQFSYARHAMLHKADELHVPAPTEAEIKAYIQALPAFYFAQNENETPRFSAEIYNMVRKEPARFIGINISPADFARVISEDVRIAATTRLITGPGYALPADVEKALKQADTTWTLQTATIERDSFKPAITPTDLDLTQYFAANKARFTIQPRVRASYTKISAANFPYTAPIADAELRAVYDSNPSLFPKPENTAPATLAAPASPDNDFNQVKTQVETYIRRQRSLAAANKAASDIAYKIYTDKLTPESASLAGLLSQAHASFPKELPVFSANNIPAELGQNRPAIAKEIFSSNFGAGNPVTNAIGTADGAVILFWHETFPAREPELAEVKDAVAADYVAQETQKRFVSLGQTLKTQIQAALKTGSTFEQAVTQAATGANLKAATKNIPAFTRRNPAPARADLDMNIVTAISTLNKGDVSDMSVVREGGRFVYVLDQKLPDVSPANPEYAAAEQEIAASYASLAAEEYVRKLVSTELAKSAPVSQ